MARFADVDIFLAVVRAGSFRRAGMELGVGKSTVSRAVARLETHLGAPLVVRDQRALRLTEAGVEYAAFARRAASALGAGERAVESLSGAVRGTLRVSAPPALGEACVAQMCGSFLQRHRHVSLDLVLTDAMVSFTEQRFDVAIRAGASLPDSDLTVRPLARAKMVAVATPALATTLGGPAPIPLVRFLHPDGSSRDLPPAPRPTTCRFRSNDYLSLLRLVLAGHAVGVSSELLVAEELRAGRLVRVLDAWRLPTARYWAVYPEGRRSPAKTRALVDHLVESFAAWPGAAP